MVNGVINRFNAHSVLIMPYLKPGAVAEKPDKSRNEQDMGSFNSVLQRQFNTVKSITKSGYNYNYN